MKNKKLNNSEVFLAKWLEGKLTDAEMKDLVSNEDYMAYLKLRKGLEVSEALQAPVDNTFSKIKQHIDKKNAKVKPLYTNWLTGIAASVILLFGLFAIFDNDEITVETGFGENKSIVLIDGSEVVLNSKSKIVYNENNWDEKRQLYLKGEAYFKVAKGKRFSVHTDNGSVTVLGTQFNVNSTEGFFDVVCYEGKVGVKTKTSHHILLSKNAVRKINGKKAQTFTSELNSPMWFNGESTFKSVPLHYVIKALENQYNITFNTTNIDDSEVFTGGFPHQNLNIALKTVFETLNITYYEKEKGNIKLRYNK